MSTVSSAKAARCSSSSGGLSCDRGRLLDRRDSRFPGMWVLLAKARIRRSSEPLEREQPSACEWFARTLETLVEVPVDGCARRPAGESAPVDGGVPSGLHTYPRARLVVADLSPQLEGLI